MVSEQLLRRNVKRFRGGLVFEAHRLFYHSTLGLRVTTKKKRDQAGLKNLEHAHHGLREGFGNQEARKMAQAKARIWP